MLSLCLFVFVAIPLLNMDLLDVVDFVLGSKKTPECVVF